MHTLPYRQRDDMLRRAYAAIAVSAAELGIAPAPPLDDCSPHRPGRDEPGTLAQQLDAADLEREARRQHADIPRRWLWEAARDYVIPHARPRGPDPLLVELAAIVQRDPQAVGRLIAYAIETETRRQHGC